LSTLLLQILDDKLVPRDRAPFASKTQMTIPLWLTKFTLVLHRRAIDMYEYASSENGSSCHYTHRHTATFQTFIAATH